ncbi:zinc finger MYM-type protein 1-like [Macrobrachium rosenbergii]|uniref:zinc finger MYM-type protein 1-like n=1 Tax=Macrobrachium rosenbergii TaxID=79674 RepID=UPI0034D46629
MNMRNLQILIRVLHITVKESEVEANREHVKCLLRVTSLLGRQGLAFRGHDESETSDNRGNFSEILDMLADSNEILRKKMESRYGHYTSPEYQNDLIQVFGNKVLTTVSTQIKKAKYFAILVDETKDRSRKEQLCLIIRFFDGEKIQERCCGTYHMQQLDAESLANFILKKLDELGLELSNCIAQCYDGASVMSGWASGVQARVAEKVPHAIYIHCYAHRLNLVLIDCIKLERTVATRWFYWYRSIYKIRVRYEAILAVLDSLSESTNEASMEASGLKLRMES